MTKHPRRTVSFLLAFLLVVLAGWTPEALAWPAMPYVALGDRPGEGRKLSRLILGTDHLGNVPREQTLAVLDEAVRLGINAFDTSPIYTDDIELKLGQWLQAKHRSDLYVITKGGFPRDLGPGTYQSRLKGGKDRIVANVREEVQGSRSRYDHPITLYLMHRDDVDYLDYARVQRPQTPVRTILEALSSPDLRRNYELIGVSNWATARVEESQRIAREHPELMRPVANSPYFSLLEMGPVTIHSGGVQVTHADMMRPDFQQGVRLMTYSALGGFSIIRRGWEAAKQDALERKNRHDRYWGHVYDAIFTASNAQRYRRAIAFTGRLNRQHGTHYTVDQIMSAYVLAHPRADFMVIGPRTVDELHRTVRALEVAKLLTPRDLEYLYADR